MPRSLDPETRIVFVLECDKDKSPQPRAFGRTQSIRQSRQLMMAMESMKTAINVDAKLEGILDAAMSVITGWENMTDPTTGEAIPFSRENLESVYSIEELIEIMQVAASGGRLDADDKKKSELPHSSVAENSVPVAQEYAAAW